MYNAPMSGRTNGHTDIPSGDWIDRKLPPWARPYARLIRLDRPSGTWLLLLPCWWGVALAGGKIPALFFLLLFAAGAVVMRGAGCIVNDIYDRDIDRKVERTKGRPLASGEIALWQALVFLFLLLLMGFAVLSAFNPLTFWLGVFSLVFVFTYPLAKRFTWWPQLVLGLAFNWGAIMGWTAVRDSIGLTPVLLYLAGVCWTLGYDTIYAHQDKDDDAMIGVKSLALKLGKKSLFWVAMFYFATLILLTAAGAAAGLGKGFYLAMLMAVSLAAWLVLGWNPDDPASCLKRFRINREFGLIVFAAIVIGKIF